MSPMTPSNRDRVLADARRARRRPGVPGAAAQRVSVPDRSDRRSGRAADVPEADGRVDRPRGHRRVHAAAGGKNRPVRASARRTRPRQAALLRHGDDARRRRDRAARRKPRGTADQDRGQPGASGQPRRVRRLRAGGDSRPLRSRSLADADEPRRNPSVDRFSRGDARRARGPAAARRRRPSHPHRVGQLADAGRADSRAAAALPVGEVASVGSRSAATTPSAGARLAFGRHVETQFQPRSRRRHRLARRRPPRRRPRRAFATRATSPAGGGPSRPIA